MPDTDPLRSQLRAMLLHSEQPLALHRGGVVLDANGALCSLLGFVAPEQIIGRNFTDFIHPGWLGGVPTNLCHGANGTVDISEYALCDVSGGRIDVEAIATPLLLDGLVTFILLLRGPHPRHEQTDRQIERDCEALFGTIASGVAHEINNPMTFVISNLNFIERVLGAANGRTPDPDLAEAVEACNETRKGAARVALAVRDLNALASSHDAPIVVDMNELLNTVSRLAAPVIRAVAEFSFASEPLPAARGVPSRIAQVLLHLLVLSVKSMPQRTDDRVQLRGVAKNGRAVVELVRSAHRAATIDKFGAARSLVEAQGATLTMEERPDALVLRLELPAAVP